MQVWPMRLHKQSAAEAFIGAPIEPKGSGSTDPEFIRLPDLERRCGIKRGIAYRLIQQGKIKSISLRQPGAATGLRLIHLQSVRDFLHAQMNEAGI